MGDRSDTKYGELKPILFYCEGGGHLVSRGDAIRQGGQLVCPRHYRERGPEQQTLAAGGDKR